MEPDSLDAIVDEILTAALVSHGLRPTMVDGCIASGLDHLHFSRGQTQYGEIDGEILAALEINAVLRHPQHGDVVVSDLVTQRAVGAGEAFRACATSYVRVTAPALLGLFGVTVPDGEVETLTTLTDGSATAWRVLGGGLDVDGAAAEVVSAFLAQTPPLALAIDALCGFLHEERLHWCKLYASDSPQTGLVSGCAIDGVLPPDAEGEMREKWTLPKQEGRWQWRQFYAMYPDGEPTDERRQNVLAAAGELPRPSGRSRWPRRRP